MLAESTKVISRKLLHYGACSTTADLADTITINIAPQFTSHNQTGLTADTTNNKRMHGYSRKARMKYQHLVAQLV